MKILVADREEELKGVVDILAKTPGNEIRSARTGDEALELAQTEGVDLLITEVFMEPMNGFTLRNKMENRHPRVRTIFMSAYDLAPYAEHTYGYEVIAKPMTPHKLFQAIARSRVESAPAAPAPAPVPTPAPIPAPAPSVAKPEPEPAATQMPLPMEETPAPTPTRIPVPGALAGPTTAPVAVPAATPVAVPKATPVPTATPVAVPRDTPVPAATPVAVPKATPVPAATPVAVPRATPVPTATPVAVPKAALAPAATPVAVPRATPAPAATPVAVPKATPAPAATPVAVPKATPAPAATPAAVPKATPTSTATPVAVPRATPAPAATPVAVPKATPAPAATPAAVPKATPISTATPVAVPRATPTPAAIPVAVPKVTPAPTATPVAVPRATPAPAATPVAVPKPTPVPSAKAVAIPKATPTPVATPKAAPAPAATPDPFLGKNLGNYRIERRLGTGKWGAVYLANQTSVNRPVAMEVLSPEKAADESARQMFVATARAKAAVQHPHILSVYEADQADGCYFYTHEYVDGFTLAQIRGRGESLTEPVALQTIKCISQGLSHLHQHQIAHSTPDSTDIYIGSDGLPYLSNVALPGQALQAPQDEIHTLGAIIKGMLPSSQAQDRGLQAMLMRTAVTTQAGFQSWPALLQAVQAIEPKVIPVDAFKISEQDEAAIRAVEEARKLQKMQVIFSVAGLFVFLCVLGFLIWWNFMRPETHDYSNEMVEIPAGEFIYGTDGQKLMLHEFYIDKYEVTMAEYARFLDFLAQHGNPTDYDSPLQPQGRSHIPHDWDIYYGRASSSIAAYRTVRGVPLTLDCPVFNVDYFDAYAYAKWKGRRLPTEEEWEKAARGANGNLYPWGNDWDPKKLNAGGDFMAAPPDGYKPAVDGYNWWAPVDAFSSDRSPYGVIGMAGNVSEWTNSWDASKTYVVIRGGNYKSTQEKAQTTYAIRNAYPQTIAETLGFRTASDAAPSK